MPQKIQIDYVDVKTPSKNLLGNITIRERRVENSVVNLFVLRTYLTVLYQQALKYRTLGL